jgi:hypothetical protein
MLISWRRLTGYLIRRLLPTRPGLPTVISLRDSQKANCHLSSSLMNQDVNGYVMLLLLASKRLECRVEGPGGVLIFVAR